MDNDLKIAVNDMRRKAIGKTRKRIGFFKQKKEWYEAIKEIIFRLKQHSDLLRVYINIDAITGLECDVICKKNMYIVSQGKMHQIETWIFDTFNIWGYIRVHDIRGESSVYYNKHYKIELHEK
jgi:hypothetical protein